jgi:hypothetical protein
MRRHRQCTTLLPAQLQVTLENSICRAWPRGSVTSGEAAYSGGRSSLLIQPTALISSGPLRAPCNPGRIGDIQMSANRDQQSSARHRAASCESGTWRREAARSRCPTIQGNDDEACDVPWIRRQSRLRRRPKMSTTSVGNRSCSIVLAESSASGRNR